MWWAKVPDFPLGAPSVRAWLFLRFLFGLCDVFSIVSVKYLPLAEATVIRFLIPIITSWACSVFLNETFTKKEQLAGLVSLIGVAIIAHPGVIFGTDENLQDPVQSGLDKVTSAQRLIAIGFSMIGIFGGSGAYTVIRVIGPRAHALISVNYFAFFTTIASAVSLLVIPGIGFKIPSSAREWLLLCSLGILGFFLQFLLTAGLQLDRSSKATSMMYTQVLFALFLDWAIWGVVPGLWSAIGGIIVIISTLWVALQKTQKTVVSDSKSTLIDEESALLGAQTEGVEEV
ncbi:MAG: hypothetical protein M1818_005914 [Claussenomyces sp. TS43310]|nr:MAG: hypothetical protein M1818_005914 [Claussenomyces sp. TS43310]